MALLFSQTSVAVNMRGTFSRLVAGGLSGFLRWQYFTRKINMLWAIFRFTFGCFSGSISISQKPG
jgi:hypothetical protein